MVAEGGSSWDDGTLCFRYPDPGRSLAGVRLLSSVLHADLEFATGGWELRRDAPAVQRLEYKFELVRADGTRTAVVDPGNPAVAPGGFGDSSVLHAPGYQEPDWLHRSAAAGTWRSLRLPVRALQTTLTVRVWSPDQPDDPAGRILVAHDGADYDEFGGLGRYTATMIRAGRVPAYHLVLLPAGERTEWYSASPAYALALAGEILPRLRATLRGRRVVGAGSSLGALAMLHAQRRHPAAFAGLLLQSGSFFQPRYDAKESGFEHWQRIVRFTGGVLRSPRGPAVPVAMTCGTVEENLPNNRDMADALGRQGYPVAFAVNPDAHTWGGWRDTLHPHLTSLLRQVWPD